MQRRLGHLRVCDRRIALLENLHLELRELRYLPFHLAESLADVLAQLLGDGQIAALDVDAHRSTSLRDGVDSRWTDQPSLRLSVCRWKKPARSSVEFVLDLL